MLNRISSLFYSFRIQEENSPNFNKKMSGSGNSSANNNSNSNLNTNSAFTSVSCSYLSSSMACSTKVEPIRLSQDWTIENFSPLLKLCKPGHCLRSHVFRHPSLLEATWQLCMYPAGKRIENNGFISLFLKMSSTSPNREILVTAEYKFHFLDDNRQVKFTNVNVGDFHAKPPKCGHSWGLRNIPKNRVISALRSDGSLLVHCEIEFLPDPCRLRSHAVKPLAVSDKDLITVARSYINNTASLLRDDILTDCQIVVYAKNDVIVNNNNNNNNNYLLPDLDSGAPGALGGAGPLGGFDAALRNDDVITVDGARVENGGGAAVAEAAERDDEPRDDHVINFEVSRDAPPTTANGGAASADDDVIEGDGGATTADDDDKSALCRKVIFKAHKCLLAAHSEVFKAMFNHVTLRESQKNAIIITDFSPDIVGAMLDYIYTCGTDFLSKLTNPVFSAGDGTTDSTNYASELLALAEKYSMAHLKYACEDFLSSKIQKDNVCQILALSDLHRAESLKKICLNFFSLNRRDLLNSEEWAELKNLRPKLTNEILEFLLRQNSTDSDWPCSSGSAPFGGGVNCLHYPPEKKFKTESTNQNRANCRWAGTSAGHFIPPANHQRSQMN